MSQETNDIDLPRRIIFQVFDTKTYQFEPYGSMRWNGEEWEVEQENRYHSIRIKLNQVIGFSGKILTKKDREFYKPFWHIPTTGTRVDVIPVPYPYRKNGDSKNNE